MFSCPLLHGQKRLLIFYAVFLTTEQPDPGLPDMSIDSAKSPHAR